MSKRKSFDVVNLETPEKDKKIETEWSYCFICQNVTDKSPITKPFNNPKFKTDPKSTSYLRIASQLLKLQSISELFLSLERRISTCSTEDDLCQYFAHNHAIFHKRCTLDLACRYNRISEVESVPTTSFTESDENQKRFSRRNLSSVNFLEVCFFCDEGNE